MREFENKKINTMFFSNFFAFIKNILLFPLIFLYAAIAFAILALSGLMNRDAAFYCFVGAIIVLVVSMLVLGIIEERKVKKKDN